MVRRIIAVITLAALMAAMLVAVAPQALAQEGEDGRVCIQAYPQSLLCELGVPSVGSPNIPVLPGIPGLPGIP